MRVSLSVCLSLCYYIPTDVDQKSRSKERRRRGEGMIWGGEGGIIRREGVNDGENYKGGGRG